MLTCAPYALRSAYHCTEPRIYTNTHTPAKKYVRQAGRQAGSRCSVLSLLCSVLWLVIAKPNNMCPACYFIFWRSFSHSLACWYHTLVLNYIALVLSLFGFPSRLLLLRAYRSCPLSVSASRSPALHFRLFSTIFPSHHIKRHYHNTAQHFHCHFYFFILCSFTAQNALFLLRLLLFSYWKFNSGYRKCRLKNHVGYGVHCVQLCMCKCINTHAQAHNERASGSADRPRVHSLRIVRAAVVLRACIYAAVACIISIEPSLYL